MLIFKKYKTFSVLIYSYINTSGNRKNEKLCAVSGNVDQSKPDSHFNSQIDLYISCILIERVLQQNASQMLRENTVPSPWGTYQL